MNDFHPDLIIAFGGGSPMDAAKIGKQLTLKYFIQDAFYENFFSSETLA